MTIFPPTCLSRSFQSGRGNDCLFYASTGQHNWKFPHKPVGMFQSCLQCVGGWCLCQLQPSGWYDNPRIQTVSVKVTGLAMGKETEIEVQKCQWSAAQTLCHHRRRL